MTFLNDIYDRDDTNPTTSMLASSRGSVIQTGLSSSRGYCCGPSQLGQVKAQKQRGLFRLTIVLG